MPHPVLQLQNPDNPTEHCFIEWSSIVDAPTNYFDEIDMTTSFLSRRKILSGEQAEEMIAGNRAGPNEEELNMRELWAYLMSIGVPVIRNINEILQRTSKNNLMEAARERYGPGTGPWEKNDLDPVDLVWFEMMSEQYQVYSDERGLMSGAISFLVSQVRKLSGYKEPE